MKLAFAGFLLAFLMQIKRNGSIPFDHMAALVVEQTGRLNPVVTLDKRRARTYESHAEYIRLDAAISCPLLNLAGHRQISVDYVKQALEVM